jgi:YggT family protein
MSANLLQFIGLVLQVFSILVIARALTSWFPSARHHPIVQILYDITDPVMVPASRFIPRLGMIDISPMIIVFSFSYIGQALGAPRLLF